MKLVENDKYYYDAESAERPVKWIQKFLQHYEDKYAGTPFLLLGWQKQIIRDVFGWKRRSDGLRRFREVYIEIAKGNGKSPFITAIALYVFFVEPQKGQQIFSIATDFKQANITFDMAKKMILASPKLVQVLGGPDNLKQYEIIQPSRNGKWALMSGTAEGKHGFRPNVIVADEAHEWDNRKLYDNVTSNLLKRSEPLMLIATNAGSDRQSICYELHQRAMRAASGESKDESLYPCIFAADTKDDWSLPATWAKANPSLGFTITEDALRLEYVKAKENPALEARFRRLFLSQWIQGADKWLDMASWDACVGEADEDLTALPCYLGLDLSQSDDLTALVAVFIGKHRLYVKSWTYVPRKAAMKYEEQDAMPYFEWADQKHIRLLETDTVDDDAIRRIEKFIVKLTKKYKVQTIGYDRAKANSLVARLEKQNIVCVPVPQSIYVLDKPSKELERRLKARSIVLPDNPCLRWQASNVEVIADNNGLIRPAKEAQKGRYAGRRGCKIDGIVALIIALSEVLNHEMRDAANPIKNWSGEVLLV